MAFQTTSMRAKEALRSFRRRTEAGKQEREDSGVSSSQGEEPLAMKSDSSLTESTSEAEPGSTPVVVVSDSEGENDNINTKETEMGHDEQEEEIVAVENPPVCEGVDEIKDTIENESESGELDSEVNAVQET